MLLEKLLWLSAASLAATLIAVQGLHAVECLHIAACFWRDHIAANL